MLDNSRDGTKHLTGLDFGPDGGSKSGSCRAINPDKTKVTKVMKWQETDRVEIVELPIEGCPDNSSQDNSSRTIRRGQFVADNSSQNTIFMLLGIFNVS